MVVVTTAAIAPNSHPFAHGTVCAAALIGSPDVPKFLEDRLRAEAAKQGLKGKQADRYVYGAMNNLGAMKGNQETPKGARMDAKHAKDMKAGTAEQQQPHKSHPGKNLGQFLHPRRSKG